jgi:transposase-like protein
VDETAICDGQIISNPSSSSDTLPNTQWILGGVVEGCSTMFFVSLVPNRKSETILKEFIKYIQPGSIIVSDGYPSYPKAASQFGSIHEIVNHSVGFVNEDGAHTNQIENFWSHLKHDYSKRSGLLKDRIVPWLKAVMSNKRPAGH